MFVWAPSRCPPFCPEALQPTGVGHINFGTVGKKANDAASLPKSLVTSLGLDTGFLSRVPVMTATPVPFWPLEPEKTVPSASAVWAFKMTRRSTGNRQIKRLSFQPEMWWGF
jgi:hypothetical protein